MAIRGFIEITPGLDPRRVQEIVEAAQGATRGGSAFLVFGDLPLEESLVEQAREAGIVIADSDKVSATLFANGILHMRAQEGLFYLRSLASDAAGRVSPPSPNPVSSRPRRS